MIYKFGNIFGLTPNYLLMTQHAMCSYVMKLHGIFAHQLIIKAKRKQLKGAFFFWELIFLFLLKNCSMTTANQTVAKEQQQTGQLLTSKLSTGTTTNRTIAHALQFFSPAIKIQNMSDGLKFLAWRKCKNVWVFAKEIYCLNICSPLLALATKLLFFEHCHGSVQKLKSWTWYGSTIEQSCSFVFGIHAKRKGVLTGETIYNYTSEKLFSVWQPRFTAAVVRLEISVGSCPSCQLP